MITTAATTGGASKEAGDANGEQCGKLSQLHANPKLKDGAVPLREGQSHPHTSPQKRRSDGRSGTVPAKMITNRCFFFSLEAFLSDKVKNHRNRFYFSGSQCEYVKITVSGFIFRAVFLIKVIFFTVYGFISQSAISEYEINYRFSSSEFHLARELRQQATTADEEVEGGSASSQHVPQQYLQHIVKGPCL